MTGRGKGIRNHEYLDHSVSLVIIEAKSSMIAKRAKHPVLPRHRVKAGRALEDLGQAVRLTRPSRGSQRGKWFLLS